MSATQRDGMSWAQRDGTVPDPATRHELGPAAQHEPGPNATATGPGSRWRGQGLTAARSAAPPDERIGRYSSLTAAISFSRPSLASAKSMPVLGSV